MSSAGSLVACRHHFKTTDRWLAARAGEPTSQMVDFGGINLDNYPAGPSLMSVFHAGALGPLGISQGLWFALSVG